MASINVTPSGVVQIIPDTAIDVFVQNNPNGLASSGVVAIVGEAEEGPSWTQDLANGRKVSANFYSPTDLSKVIQKYGEGRIVDAFIGAAQPSSSAKIQGAPQAILIVKTNSSTASSVETLDASGEFTAKRGGLPGNQIQEQILTTTPEVAPSTGEFSYAPNAASAALALRVNGGAQQTVAISANTTPTALAAQLSALANVNAVGGVDIAVTSGLSASNSVALSVISGQEVDVILTSPAIWNNPSVGDTLHIPSGSVLAGAGNANVGWYIVTGVVNTTVDATITAIKKTAGAPVNVSVTALSATPANDLVEYSAISINNESGTNRSIISPSMIGDMISIAVAGSVITATLAAAQWASNPVIGDLLHIPSGSAYAGAGNANVGWYQVIQASNTSTSAFIQAQRLTNGNPLPVSSTAIVSINDLQDYDPQLRGLGKALESYDNGGTVDVDQLFFMLGSASIAASWIGEMLISQAELEKTITIKQPQSNIQQVFTAGGTIALTLGYDGTTASATIGPVSNVLMLTTSVLGGPGANLSIDLTKLSTINDLVIILNEQPGYSAAVGNAQDGLRNPSILDQATAQIDSTLGNRPGRFKHDSYDLTTAPQSVNQASTLVSYAALVPAGLPQDNAFTLLSGGLKGPTTALEFVNAIDALQGATCNFVVPLISQDASKDIALGETDPASTYAITAINQAVKDHVIAMSNPKIKKHRVGVVSIRDTFAASQDQALNLANFRIACLFQDISITDSQGNQTQFQPWMGSTITAAMQAAGGYKPIFNKAVNIISAIDAAGDFDDQSIGDCEDAILAGLIPIQQHTGTGWVLLTDQTTYGTDNNIVYNSLQAVYVSDLMALSLAQALRNAFVGEAAADVTTSGVLGFLKGKMAEFLAAKYTVGTTQYPGGWVNMSANLNGNVLLVNVSVVIDSAIKFIPIELQIQGVQSQASA